MNNYEVLENFLGIFYIIKNDDNSVTSIPEAVFLNQQANADKGTIS